MFNFVIYATKIVAIYIETKLLKTLIK